MNAWHTSREEWVHWIDADAEADRPVWVSCDQFDEDLRTMLERSPFLGGLDQTSVTMTPISGETRPPDGTFDSMTTLVRPSPLQLEEQEDTIASVDAGETLVRGQVMDERFDVGVAAPEAGLEVGLDPPPSSDPVEGLYIPNLTRGATTPPMSATDSGVPPPPPSAAFNYGGPVQPVPGGTVIAEHAPTADEVMAWARQHGYHGQQQQPPPPPPPPPPAPPPEQPLYASSGGTAPGGEGETQQPTAAPHPVQQAFTEAHEYLPAPAPDPLGSPPGVAVLPEGLQPPVPPSPVDHELPPGADGTTEPMPRPPDADANRAEPPLPPPPLPPPSTPPPLPESVMDTPPAVDLELARAQMYDDEDDEFTEDVPAEPPAASSQTAGEIVTLAADDDDVDSLRHGALEEVLDEDEPSAEQKIVIDPSASGRIPVGEEEVEPDEIMDDVAPTPAPPHAKKGEGAPPPLKREGAKPPPAPKQKKRDAPPPETAAALAQLHVEREGGAEAVLEKAAKEAAPATGGWYEETFGDHFAALIRTGHAAEAKAEIEFFVQSSGLQPGSKILDVGCGDGAHSLVLAQRGYAVTGFDTSLPQLLRATRANEALAAGAHFVHGDVREPPVDGLFAGILCVGTTLGYFDEDDNRKAIRKLRELLAPGGRMMIQVFNRDHVVSRLPARSWWQGHGCLVLDEAQMNYFSNRLQIHRTIVFEDGRQFEHNIEIRAYTAHDLGSVCVDAGLRVVEISGSRLTRGRFYGATSPEIWLLVERAPSRA